MISPSQTNYSPSLKRKNARKTSVDNWFHFLVSRNFPIRLSTNSSGLAERKFVYFTKASGFAYFLVLTVRMAISNLKQNLTIKFRAFLYFSLF